MPGGERCLAEEWGDSSLWPPPHLLAVPWGSRGPLISNHLLGAHVERQCGALQTGNCPITRPLTSLVSVWQRSCSKPMEGPARLRPHSSMISAPKHFPRLQNKQGSICTNSIASVRGLPLEPGSEVTASHTILSTAPAAPGRPSLLSSPQVLSLSFSPLMLPQGLPMGVHLEGLCVCVCVCVTSQK